MKVYFHGNNKVAIREIHSFEELVEAVKVTRRKMKEPIICPDCGQSYLVTQKHICADVVDASFVDEKPLLPPKADK